MAKTKISEFDVDPANNTDINSINIAEGCAPSGINNAIRQLMSDLKEFQTGAASDDFTVGGAFAANGGATLGNASGDALTINSSAVSIPNGLNFDSNTFVIDASNNRVGINNASPSAPLDVVGSAFFGSSATTNSYVARFYNQNSGLYVGVDSSTGGNTGTAYAQYFLGIGAYPMTFWTNTSERMRIDSSGNVGIGTSSPYNPVGSSMTAATINGSTYGVMYLQANGGTVRLALGANTANNTCAVTTLTNHPLTFATNDTERLRIDSSGCMGLGVTPFTNTISVGLDFANGSGIFGYSNGTYLNTNAYYNGGWKYKASAYATQYVSGGGTHQWLTAPSGTAGNAITFTQAMTLDASGNLGIGNTSPTEKLTVTGNIALSGGISLQNNQGPYWGGGTAYISYNTSSNYLSFGTNSVADRMRIDSSGNLSVGTTSAFGRFTAASTTTTVAGYFTTSGNGRVAQFMSTAGADSSNFGIYVAKYANDSTTSQRFIGFSINNDSNGSGQINANGASQAAFGSFSDIRLKENIVDLPSQLSNIMALRPVEFDYKTGGHQTGFIAQEMQQVFPDAVGHDGSENKYLTVTGWNKTEAILVKAIQEQQTIINDLKARIETLESK